MWTIFETLEMRVTPVKGSAAYDRSGRRDMMCGTAGQEARENRGGDRRGNVPDS
jgi:hypothetical protein